MCVCIHQRQTRQHGSILFDNWWLFVGFQFRLHIKSTSKEKQVIEHSWNWITSHRPILHLGQQTHCESTNKCRYRDYLPCVNDSYCIWKRGVFVDDLGTRSGPYLKQCRVFVCTFIYAHTSISCPIKAQTTRSISISNLYKQWASGKKNTTRLCDLNAMSSRWLWEDLRGRGEKRKSPTQCYRITNVA